MNESKKLSGIAERADDKARKAVDAWRRAPELDAQHEGSEAWRHFWTGSVRWVKAKFSSENTDVEASPEYAPKINQEVGSASPPTDC
jgi:hypothetical protein